MSSPAQAWMQWLNAALGLLYPEVCQFCRNNRAGPSQGYVCEECGRSVHLIQRPFCERCGLPFEGAISTRFECGRCQESGFCFSTARSAVVAEEVVREAVHRYKYHRALWVEPFLAELLCRQAAPELAGAKWDYLVPVPLHPVRFREREFNQAERLAARLAEATGIPVNKSLLKRVKITETQTHLTREQRAENVRRAFSIRPRAQVFGLRLVVIDDVFTTGATTGVCAQVLKAAGADEVCVWTVARGI